MSYSVIIPSYNSAEYIPKVIESVLRQTHAPAEVVLVDDGSTDDSERACEPYRGRIRYVRQGNGGVAKARNHGAELTSAEWLLFLDSDDMLLPHAAESLLAAAIRQQADVAYGRVIARGRAPSDDRLHGLPSASGAPPAPAKANFKRSVITTPGAAIVRRDLYLRVGGFVPGYEPMEDRDFWVKCGALASFAFCDTVVLDKTFREGSAGTQIARRTLSSVRAKLAFLDWCRERGIDSGFLGVNPAAIMDQGLREALWHRCWGILESLCAQANALGVRSYWYHRAKWQLRVLRLLGAVK